MLLGTGQVRVWKSVSMSGWRADSKNPAHTLQNAIYTCRPDRLICKMLQVRSIDDLQREILDAKIFDRMGQPNKLVLFLSCPGMLFI